MRSRSRALPWLVLAALVLSAAAAALEVIAARIVDADLIAGRIARELGDERGEVSVGAAAFSLFRGRVEMRDVVVVQPRRGILAADRLVLGGVPPFGRGEGRPLEIDRIMVERPFVYRSFRSLVDEGGPRDRAADSAAFRVGELRIEGATVLVRGGGTPGPRTRLVRDLDIDARGLELDRIGRIVGPPESLAWRSGRVLRVRADGLTRLTFDSTRASSRDSSLLLQGGRYGPIGSDGEFLRRLDRREDRIRARLPWIALRAVDVGALPFRKLEARAIDFDAVHLDVLTDRRIPAGPSTPWLPRELLRSFEGELRVDTARLRGRIEYRDHPPESVPGPGRIVFDDIDAHVLGISNAPEAPSIVARATMRVFEAPAEIRLEIPTRGEEFRMSMEGRTGALDLPELNALTVPLEGIEFQDGRLEGMRFDIRVEGRTAGGTVWVAYHGLDVQIVDRRTGEGNLFDDIGSFLANTFVFRGDNMPDDGAVEAPVRGVVEYYVPSDVSFFSRVWGPIRSGLMAVARK
ncbi:MAG: hypothetical protein ACODAA_05315 [Gemmatimonadota bacterium]